MNKKWKQKTEIRLLKYINRIVDIKKIPVYQKEVEIVSKAIHSTHTNNKNHRSAIQVSIAYRKAKI